MIDVVKMKTISIGIIGLSSLLLTGCGGTIQTKVAAPQGHKIQKVSHVKVNKSLQLKKASNKKAKGTL